jgi:hypothetical protein
MEGGVGRTSAAINGMMTTAPTITVWAAIDNGTVYHFWLPNLIDGLTTSPNKSRGTAVFLLRSTADWRRPVNNDVPDFPASGDRPKAAIIIEKLARQQ